MAAGDKTRCKFTCISVQENQSQGGNQKTTYGANLEVVYGGSDENEKFYATTPTGNLSLNGMARQPFQTGKEYYLDLIEAPPKGS